MSEGQIEAQRRIEECAQERIPYLDPSGLGLVRIPQEIAEPTWIERLSFSRSELSDLSPSPD